MMTILCYLIVCLMVTEAAPAETATGDKDTEEMKHEMRRYIRHQEKMIIDTIIKNVTESTTKEMKVLERALPDIRDLFNSSLQQLTERIDALEERVQHNSCLQDCIEWRSHGNATSGFYKVCPRNGPSTNVYCDMVSDGGGWVIFQSRKYGYVHFNQSWAKYTSGFGNLNGDFWLGFDKMSQFMGTHTELRIDLVACNNSKGYAKYHNFHIGDNSTKYLLSVSGYTGNIGDLLRYNNNMKFSTHDQDNDRDSDNCAQNFNAGYWYDHCTEHNYPKTALNGPYPDAVHKDSNEAYYHKSADYIYWSGWPTQRKNDAICSTEMKLRKFIQV